MTTIEKVRAIFNQDGRCDNISCDSLTEDECPLFSKCTSSSKGFDMKKLVCKGLLNPLEPSDVWNGAPDWAVSTYRVWNSNDGRQKCSETVTRTITKSREREIAEEKAFSMSVGSVYARIEKSKLADEIEHAILQARKEWEAKIREGKSNRTNE